MRYQAALRPEEARILQTESFKVNHMANKFYLADTYRSHELMQQIHIQTQRMSASNPRKTVAFS
jgi:hypothetical protein